MEAALHLLIFTASGGQQRTSDQFGPRRLPRGSRLLVFTVGPCTMGPGSLPLSSLDAGAGYHERLGGALTKEQRQQASSAQEYIAACVDLAKTLAVPVDIILGEWFECSNFLCLS